MFSASAAGTLRQVLRARGNNDPIIALHEYLDWGPIDASPTERVQWIAEHSPWEDGWDWLADTVEEFKANVAARDNRVIWIAPRSACEQAGLYWYLHLFGGGGAKMIIADFPPGEAWRGEAPLSLGELGNENLALMLDSGSPEPWDEARYPQVRWAKLIDEAALLRIVRDGELQSAESDFFDPLVLKCSPPEWTRSYQVIGQTMADAMDEGHRLDDSFLRWRLMELVGRGELELDGDLGAVQNVTAAAKVRRI